MTEPGQRLIVLAGESHAQARGFEARAYTLGEVQGELVFTQATACCSYVGAAVARVQGDIHRSEPEKQQTSHKRCQHGGSVAAELSCGKVA